MPLCRLTVKPWTIIQAVRLWCSNSSFVFETTRVGNDQVEHSSLLGIYVQIGTYGNTMKFLDLSLRRQLLSQQNFDEVEGRTPNFTPALNFVFEFGEQMVPACDMLSPRGLRVRAKSRVCEMMFFIHCSKYVHLDSLIYCYRSRLVAIYSHGIKRIRWGQDLIESLARQQPMPLDDILVAMIHVSTSFIPMTNSF